MIAKQSRRYGPVDVLLADGRVATLRSPHAEDRAALVALHEGAGQESLRRRFFTVNRRLAAGYGERLAEADGADDVLALLAIVDGRVVGVADCEVGEGHTGEIALLVADDAHGLGVGSLLIEHLAAVARARGVLRFTAEVLTDNVEMLRVFRDCGFTEHRASAGGVTSVELSTAATARAVAAADDREAHAEAASLRPLLAPRSVAVVGVRRDASGVGNAVLRQIEEGGFEGDVYVVHPTASQIDGFPAFPDFASIDGPVDLAVVAVPAEQVVAVIRAAATAGVGAAVIITSGLGEVGALGRQRQDEIVQIARQHSLRVVGPNCLGIMNPGLRLNATFAGRLPSVGDVAVASQSGGVGIALLEQAERAGLGIAGFVSLGNKADVSGNDLLACWYDDDRVKVAALYLESLGNPAKFARLARRFSQRKPLLAISGGRSDSGRRAGLSHTAAAASPSVGVDALFAYAGVIDCQDIPTLVDVARLLVAEPLPAGSRVAILSNAGGLGVLAADAAERRGLVVAPLPLQDGSGLTRCVGPDGGVQNPVDLGAAVSPAGFLAASERLLACPEVDALLLVVVGTGASDVGAFLEPLVRARATHPHKPVLVVPAGDIDLPAGLLAFLSVDAAIEALAPVVRYAAWRSAALADQAEDDTADQLETSLPADPPAAVGPGGWLGAEAVAELLSAYGIEQARARQVAGADAAVEAASALAFPVVVKSADPDVVHKTDRGLVRVGLGTPHDVRAAVDAMAVELDEPEPDLLVQEVVPGVEMAVGIIRDPGLGPLVMVAAGGTAIDVWADRVFLFPPIRRREAEAAVRSLRIWPLLNGFRGAPPADVSGFLDLVEAVARMARERPDIAELDLNPVMLDERRVVCVDAKVRVVPGAVDDDAGIPRRLSSPRGAAPASDTGRARLLTEAPSL